jgi:DNA-binding CsgD family transcriptional regulator
MLSALSQAISEAARATTLEELGSNAFPALARALDACPVFLAEAAADFSSTEALAGEYRDVLRGYLQQFMRDDPLIQVALSVPGPVTILEQYLDPKTIRGSRAYSDFHCVYDFEHHMLVRFFGECITTPGTLAMGFTRGRRLAAFGARELHIARLVLPAFNGAARRILQSRGQAATELRMARISGQCGLTRAEARVLAALSSGLSNGEIARQLCISVDTVKTHLQRVFRKLGVTSRAQALLAVQSRF